MSTAQSRIAALQAQIEELKQRATAELREKRLRLVQEIREVDAEITLLTGKTLEQKSQRKRADIVGRTPSLTELKDLLAVVPGKTLSLRKEGIDVKHVKQLVAANLSFLRMGGKGAWPTVSLK